MNGLRERLHAHRRALLWVPWLFVLIMGDAVSTQQAPAQTFTGVLTIVWADPHPTLATAGATRYLLTLVDGTTLTLALNGQEGAAVDLFGERVVVTGRTAVGAAAGDAATVIVDTLAPELVTANDVVRTDVTGTRRVIYLLARFPEDASVPHPPSFYDDLTNPDTAPPGAVFPSTLNGFFKKTSYGQFSWIGDVGGAGGLGAPGGWLTLPHPKSHYAPCGWSGVCLQFSELANDMMALGRAQGIDFTVYQNINFVMSNDLDCCAWGGGFFSAVEGRTFGATWEPPWGQEADVYAHEMGHSLGLPHSGWAYYAYDSPWDVMSRATPAQTLNCGSYASVNSGGSTSQLYCHEPGGSYIAHHQDSLGWIPPANQLVLAGPSDVTATLEGLALPLSSALKMIRICLAAFPCSGSSARYLTVEARVSGMGAPTQFDNGIPGDGVVIHEVRHDRPPIGGTCFFNSQSGRAVPVDATPGDYNSTSCSYGGRTYPNYALFNAQWAVGQTYTNAALSVGVTVVSRDASTFVVTVSTSAPSITTQPAHQTIAPGQTATLSVVALSASPVGYQWYRGPSGMVTAPIAGATSASYTTGPGVTTTRYWVRVSNSVGSVDSTAAMVSVTFTDNALAAGLSVVRAVHIVELRTRIDALRVRFGLAGFAWTDASLVPGATPLKAVHVSELRLAIEQAFGAAMVSPPAFADTTLTAGVTPVRSAHILELREAVDQLEAS